MEKMGIVDEMMEDAMGALDDDYIEDAVDSEVDKVLFELTAGQLGQMPDAQSNKLPQQETNLQSYLFSLVKKNSSYSFFLNNLITDKLFSVQITKFWFLIKKVEMLNPKTKQQAVPDVPEVESDDDLADRLAGLRS